jgi:murein DD-endopeptidase MepM/ murein hydrolase activator NlpD
MPPSCGLRNRLSLVLALLLWVPAAMAATRLEGRPVQGGLVAGRTDPGARVQLDGRPVPVDAEGRFLLGFGRDADPETRLSVTLSGGATEERLLAVARRDWPEQRIDGLPRHKTEPDAASLARLGAETAMIRAIRARVTDTALVLGGLTRPVDGPVSGVFGSRRFYNGMGGAPHSGLDIAAPEGAPVGACGGGTVVLAAPDLFLTGRTVMIDHGLGLISTYAHLSRVDVHEGQRVGKGELIGAVGSSGLASGPHLHWGLSWLDIRIDPETALAKGISHP